MFQQRSLFNFKTDETTLVVSEYFPNIQTCFSIYKNVYMFSCEMPNKKEKSVSMSLFY